MTTTDTDRRVEAMRQLEAYHRKLTHHAARILGSGFEAEDAVQETMMRAWSALGRFEGRCPLRSWLYRICTNVCLSMLASGQRRARLALEVSGDELISGERIPLSNLERSAPDPADMVVARESVRFALVTLLQRLPPKQRAVLILREVLRWSATEIAEFLDTSVASVNSALQRGRATLRIAQVTRDPAAPIDTDAATVARLDRFARALEESDVSALTKLVAHEAA